MQEPFQQLCRTGHRHSAFSGLTEKHTPVLNNNGCVPDFAFSPDDRAGSGAHPHLSL